MTTQHRTFTTGDCTCQSYLVLWKGCSEGSFFSRYLLMTPTATEEESAPGVPPSRCIDMASFQYCSASLLILRHHETQPCGDGAYNDSPEAAHKHTTQLGLAGRVVCAAHIIFEGDLDGDLSLDDRVAVVGLPCRHHPE